MLKTNHPTDTQAWKNLALHYKNMESVKMSELFAQDPNRFQHFSTQFEDILLDFSKNRITQETLKLLGALAEELDLKDAIEQMFTGSKINQTEDRAVLHVALRNLSMEAIEVDGQDVMPEVKAVLDRMESFVNRLHGGEHLGYTGKKITQIVNIGIGGSDLGPVMVTEALKPYWQADMEVFYVSNVDGTHIAETLKKVLEAIMKSVVSGLTFFR
ncbi:MAG: glucose-6-phosphate isomerase, partial [Bacteroidota bacterium]